MQVRLKIQQGSNVGKEVKIPTPKCVIGRGDDCDLRPQSDAISRRHCVIVTTENEVIVRDLKSRNGTRVNGVAAADTRIDPGDELTIAKHRYEFRYLPIDLGAVGPPPDELPSNVFDTTLLERAGLEHRGKKRR